MAGQPGFFDVEERLKELSAKGDALERLSAVVDFELFRADLEHAVVRSDRSRGGRPPFDHVLMFKVLILQSSHNLLDERTEYLIRDRLSFMRFLGLELAGECQEFRAEVGHDRSKGARQCRDAKNLAYPMPSSTSWTLPKTDCFSVRIG